MSARSSGMPPAFADSPDSAGTTASPARPRVSAIVPTYNSGALLDRCLDALAASDAVDDVTVLDGGSTDGTDERAAARAGVRVVRMEGTPLTRRFNEGLRLADHDLVLMLNDDAFVDPETPGRLAAVMAEHPDVAIAGARLRYDDGSEQRSAGRGTTLAGVILNVLGVDRFLAPLMSPGVRADPATGLERAEWLPLCAALVRTRAVQDVGGFDERFSFYAEDQDIARRVKRAGWNIVVHPRAGAVHLGGGSTRSKGPGPWFTRFHQSRGLYLRKHYPRGWRVYEILWAARASLHLVVWNARAMGSRLRSDRERERAAREWAAAFRRARRLRSSP